MRDWAERAAALVAAGQPVALVTILATRGSAPREAGTRMLVTADGTQGTIGGGHLEHRLIDQARRMLDEAPGTWRVQDYPLGPLLGQCCGGKVRMLVERLDADTGWLDELTQARRRGRAITLSTRFAQDRLLRLVAAQGAAPAHDLRDERPTVGAEIYEGMDRRETPLLLFGGGHVGTALARLLRDLPFRLDWIDTRAGTPAAQLSEDAALTLAQGMADDGIILVMTHDHGLDYRLVAAGLSGDAAMIGLIGSRTKRARFLARLARAGLSSDRLVCPIGLPGITGKAPEVIAIAVAAQLLQAMPATLPVGAPA